MQGRFGRGSAIGLLAAATLAAACEKGAPLGCGDGVVGEGEVCDDGNADPHDACNLLCTPAAARGWVYAEVSPVHGFITAQGIGLAPDGSIYVVGSAAQTGIDPFAEHHQGVLVRKLSPLGEPGWVRAVERSIAVDAEDVEIAGDGEPVIVGSNAKGGGSQSPWIRRYSAAGDERWTAIVNVNQGTGQAIARLEDGSFVLSGHGTDGEAPWVQRVDASGELLERVVVALAAGERNGEGLALLAAADRVFLAGSHRGEPRRALVAAFSSDLEPLWSTRDLEGVAVTLAYVDGDLIVAGSAVDGFSNRRISPGWIRRISGVDGALIWHHELDAGVGQQINDLAVDHQGAIVAVGEVSSPRLTAWMTKLDGDGEVIWEVVDPLDDVQPVPGDGRALAVAVDEDDRIFVAGRALDDLGYARLWVQEREP